jgi:hypothetical protein
MIKKYYFVKDIKDLGATILLDKTCPTPYNGNIR